jgi:hypothetical protein
MLHYFFGTSSHMCEAFVKFVKIETFFNYFYFICAFFALANFIFVQLHFCIGSIAVSFNY